MSPFRPLIAALAIGLASLTAAQAELALARGAAVIDGLGDTTVVALGEMGIGNTASAALLVHKVAGLARWFRRRLGGYTGDTLGATQQVTELAILGVAAWA